MLRLLALGREPQWEELLLADPTVKYCWRFNKNLAIRRGYLNTRNLKGDRLKSFATVKVWLVTWELRKTNLGFWKGPYCII